MSMIYKYECKECGRNLDGSVGMDSDEDITIYTEPCLNCLDKAEEEAQADMESNFELERTSFNDEIRALEIEIGDLKEEIDKSTN